MKTRFIFFTAFLFLAINSICQNPINVCQDCNNLYHTFQFNDPGDSAAFFIEFDTLQANNIWQIGTVEKSLFTAGYSGPGALVTDTLHPYPPNNISSFQFSVKNCDRWNSGWCGGYELCYVDLAYKINTDTLIDGGTIEVSHNGSPFVNLILDSLVNIQDPPYTVNDTVASLHKPGFSGTTSTWKEFGFSYGPSFASFDTITFRLTFASDSQQTNKDGWMIGSIQTGGIFEGIATIFKTDLLTIYPNPCSGNVQLAINPAYPDGVIAIYSLSGQLVKVYYPKTVNEIMPAGELPEGAYTLQYCRDRYFTVKKLIVTR